MNFGKILTAMVTPFDKKLRIDFDKVDSLVDHLLKNGTDTIVVAGTTGESPTLTKEEKMLLFDAVKKRVNGKAKVIANIGSNDTYKSLEFAKDVERLALADGLMAVCPYYNKPNQKGLYEHFKYIAENVNLPIIIYNIPGRTNVNMEYETTVRLSKLKNIVAIKESSGDLNQITKIITNTSSDFDVYSGDDNLTLPAIAVGAKGVISVSSHVVGLEMKAMIENFEKGRIKESAKTHQKLMPVFEGLFFTTNPVPVKELLKLEGIDTGGVRLPLVGIETAEEKEKIKEIYNIIHNDQKVK